MEQRAVTIDRATGRLDLALDLLREAESAQIHLPSLQRLHACAEELTQALNFGAAPLVHEALSP